MVNRSSKSLNIGDAQASRNGQSAMPDADWSYEATVQKIEAIMTRIESGDLELSQVFDQFAEAVTYLQQCENFLNQHQQQIDLLIETLTDDMDF